MNEELAEKIDSLNKLDLVIVEGMKDRRALLEYGVSKVFVISGPLYQVCETIAQKAKRVSILTDLDAEGKKIYGQLVRGLSTLGVSIDDSVRDYLFKHTQIRQIEGLSNLKNIYK